MHLCECHLLPVTVNDRSEFRKKFLNHSERNFVMFCESMFATANYRY